MTDKGSARGSLRRTLSLGLMIAGAVLLAVVPLILVVLSFAGTRTLSLPGTYVILSAVAGMALVVSGAALRD